MHSLAQLQKKQIGLKLPLYLIEQIDEFAKEYNLNRTDIIIESIKSYIENQKLEKYTNLDEQYKKVTQDIKEGKYHTSIDEHFQEIEEAIKND